VESIGFIFEASILAIPPTSVFHPRSNNKYLSPRPVCKLLFINAIFVSVSNSCFSILIIVNPCLWNRFSSQSRLFFYLQRGLTSTNANRWLRNISCFQQDEHLQQQSWSLFMNTVPFTFQHVASGEEHFPLGHWMASSAFASWNTS